MSECNSVEFNSVEKTYYQKNRDAILNRVKDYSQNHEETLSEKNKNKKREFGRNRYHIMSKERKKF